MPSSVNGVGTHYYGQSNIKLRTGICRRCQREATLKSYDTRLFIIVFFIPVWPLGRKRIIDQCPHCTGHYIMNARQWEVSGQLNASDAKTRFANEPTAESAARAHAQLLSYFQYEEARELRDQALSRLPDDGALRADLGWQLRACDQHAEALQMFDEALRLRPDLPSARSGKAPYLIAQDKLDEARELVDFLMEPGAAQMYDLGPLISLFGQLQASRRPDDALELVPHIMQELPLIKDDFWFRKTVLAAERAAGRHDSLLPPRNRSWFSLLFSNSRDFSPRTRTLARGAVLAAGVLGALAIHNESIRRQRTVYVVNQTGLPAQVRIDQEPPVTATVNQRTPITLAEGEHDVQITGPVETNEKLRVESGYFARWFQRPIWLINVNGEAVVLQLDIVYSAMQTPSVPHLHVAQTTLAFPDVDYAFDEEPPRQISVKQHENVVKRQLQILDLPAEAVVTRLIDQNPAGVLTMAERRLARQSDGRLLEAYGTAAKAHREQERAAKFLETRLDVRPIDLVWHRAYQNLRDTPTEAAGVLARYENITQNEPDSAAAWYLFARQDPDVDRGACSLDKAIELDPQLGWALYARASRAFNRGEWDEAEQGLTAALAAPASEDSWRAAKVYCLLAQQKYDAVDEECDHLAADPRFVALVVPARFWSKHKQNLPVDTLALATAATKHLSAETALPLRSYLEASIAYAGANWDALRTLHKNPQLSALAPAEKALQLISTLSLDELKAQFQQPSAVADGSDALAIALAFALADDPERAAAWRQQAIKRFHQGGHDDRFVAAVLGGEAPLAIDDLHNIHINPYVRPLVYASLAQQTEFQRDDLLHEARLWQLLPLKYYWLVEQALQKLGDP